MTNKKTLSSYLFIPFKYFTGTTTLTVGIAILLILSILGWLSGTYFDGVIDIHYGYKHSRYLFHLYFQISSWLLVSILFYLVIRFVLKNSVRLVDILGTVALSQLPLIIACLWGFSYWAHLLDDLFMEGKISLGYFQTVMEDRLGVIIVTKLIVIISAAWSLILKYNAFSICSNMRGGKAVGIFIAVILVAEIVSQIINRLFIQ